MNMHAIAKGKELVQNVGKGIRLLGDRGGPFLHVIGIG